MSVDFAVAIHCSAWAGALADPAGTARRAAAAAWGRAGSPAAGREGEIGLVLTDDAEMAGLNLRFRGRAGPTNVLSFPTGEAAPGCAAGGPPALLGDVVVALETTAREARRDGKPVADHLQHLVVHGLLHLLGYDHGDEAAASGMEALEVDILARLGVPDPYGGGCPRHG